MAAKIVIKVESIITITMDGKTALALRKYLDPTDPYVRLTDEPELYELLVQLQTLALGESNARRT